MAEAEKGPGGHGEGGESKRRNLKRGRVIEDFHGEGAGGEEGGGRRAGGGQEEYGGRELEGGWGRKRKPSGRDEGGRKLRPRGGKSYEGVAEVADHSQSHTLLKKVDAATQQYFEEIAALIGPEGSLEDPEERAILCANALDEASGKEVQVACDPSLSRVLEVLLQSAEPTKAVDFLVGCADDFVILAQNPNGSHVLETSMRAIAKDLAVVDIDNRLLTKLRKGLRTICHVVGEHTLDLISNRFASHVLRNLLALLSGAELELSQAGLWSQFGTGANAESVMEPGSKPSHGANMGLAARLGGHQQSMQQTKRVHCFPESTKQLVKGMFSVISSSLGELRVDTAAAPVFQAALKAVEGDEDTLSRAIAVLLGCGDTKGDAPAAMLEGLQVEGLLQLMEERVGSHLVEAILRAAPSSVYCHLLEHVFKGRLLQLSLHPAANFVVQALIAAVRTPAQVKEIGEELESSFADLLSQRRAGVVASLLTACGRWHTFQKEGCKALMRAALSMTDGPQPENRILPLLRLHQEQAYGKMSVIGCVILQTVLRYPKECCPQFLEGVAAMPAEQLVAAAMDPGGSRVVEAFLQSEAAAKLKQKMIGRLKGQFADLAMHAIASHTVEKCFAVANATTKEVVVKEICEIQSALSHARHGHFLLRHLAVQQYARQPESWKKSMLTKEKTLQTFAEIFGSSEKPVKEIKHISAEEKNAHKKAGKGKEESEGELETEKNRKTVESSEKERIDEVVEPAVNEVESVKVRRGKRRKADEGSEGGIENGEGGTTEDKDKVRISGEEQSHDVGQRGVEEKSEKSRGKKRESKMEVGAHGGEQEKSAEKDRDLRKRQKKSKKDTQVGGEEKEEQVGVEVGDERQRKKKKRELDEGEIQDKVEGNGEMEREAQTDNKVLQRRSNRIASTKKEEVQLREENGEKKKEKKNGKDNKSSVVGTVRGAEDKKLTELMAMLGFRRYKDLLSPIKEADEEGLDGKHTLGRHEGVTGSSGRKKKGGKQKSGKDNKGEMKGNLGRPRKAEISDDDTDMFSSLGAPKVGRVEGVGQSTEGGKDEIAALFSKPASGRTNKKGKGKGAKEAHANGSLISPPFVAEKRDIGSLETVMAVLESGAKRKKAKK